MRLALTTLAVVSISSTPVSGFSIIQWTTDQGGNGHYYEIVEVSLNWDQAMLEAIAREYAGQPGNLATVTSQGENDFIANNLLASAKFTDAWIGGLQPTGSPEPAGNWQWVTGEPWQYVNWDVSEPNNAGGNEGALWMWAGGATPGSLGKWNDAPVGFVRPYVVEYAPEPGVGLLFLVASLLPSRLRGRGRRRGLGW